MTNEKLKREQKRQYAMYRERNIEKIVCIEKARYM